MTRSKSHGSQMPSPASTNPGPAPFALHPLGPPSHRRGVSAGASGRPRGAGRRGHDCAGCGRPSCAPSAPRLPHSVGFACHVATALPSAEGGRPDARGVPDSVPGARPRAAGRPAPGAEGGRPVGVCAGRGGVCTASWNSRITLAVSAPAMVCVWQSPPGLALGRWASKGGVCLCCDATAANLWVGFPLWIKASCRKVDFSD